MTINQEQEKRIREMAQNNLLDEETLDDDNPWGEDGNMYGFERGQAFGAHELAEDILKLLDKKDEKNLEELLSSSLLDEETLEDDMPWGEDSVIYAFNNGKNFGAHNFAEEILDLINEEND